MACLPQRPPSTLREAGKQKILYECLLENSENSVAEKYLYVIRLAQRCVTNSGKKRIFWEGIVKKRVYPVLSGRMLRNATKRGESYNVDMKHVKNPFSRSTCPQGAKKACDCGENPCRRVNCNLSANPFYLFAQKGAGARWELLI